MGDFPPIHSHLMWNFFFTLTTPCKRIGYIDKDLMAE